MGVIVIKSAIQEALLLMGEPAYRAFNAKLLPTVAPGRVIGIRTPILRKYAKELEDYEDFLHQLPHQYFEENQLHAFLIEREKDFDKCLQKIEAFLPYIDNWATCDSMKPKVLQKEPKELLRHIQAWLHSPHTYAVRYGILLLMSFYLEDYFDAEYLQWTAEVHAEEYYINMMRAWYFATALAKQYEAALPYLTAKKLDLWTHNKTIQKARESRRLSTVQKEYLNTLKY